MSVDHRWFFCLQPPTIERRRIGLLRDELAGGAAVVADHRLHLTLGMTNDHPRHRPDIAARLVELGRMVDAAPFALSLDRVSAAGNVVALRPSRTPPELRLLARQIDRHLAAEGLRRDDWSFNPHVTLIYGAREPFLRPVRPFAWEARELVLIHSVVGATRHVELGRWPLVRRQLSLAF